jgi:cyclohexadienyl dehydratase
MIRRGRFARLRRAGILLAALVVAGAFAAPAEDDAQPLRVGTSGDYRPFSYRGDDAAPAGFDIALIRAFAADTGREVAFVPFAWPKLARDLAEGRFDLAASGVTVRPERSAVGSFSLPIAETRALALARNPERWGGNATLDRPSINIAVNAGGHLERVARARFPRASLMAIPDNDAVIALLAEERVHAVVTDDVEAPHWEALVDAPLARVGPLSRDRKAWLVAPDRPELSAELDAWLLEREADGSLAALRAEWLGGARAASAEPLMALLAALDERLSMMPTVGVVKRRDGLPLAVPEREEYVIDRALEDLRAAALRAEREPPPDAPVRALFRAQIDAARHIQSRAVRRDDDFPETLPDLETQLRPGLIRIGARIARLLLMLPPDLQLDTVRAAARDQLRAPHLEDTHRDALAEAIAACTATPEPKTPE